MANVIPFPVLSNRKLHLFDDEEIFVTIAAVNIFGAASSGLATTSNLFRFEAEFVIACVEQFKDCGLLSNRARVVCRNIMERYKASE